MSCANLNRAVSGVAAKRLVQRVLLLRRHHAGALLRAVRSINKIEIKNEDNFGEGLHTVHSEPYYYEAAYIYAARPSTSVVDEHGSCRSNTESEVNLKWKCSEKCKPLTNSEVCILKRVLTGQCERCANCWTLVTTVQMNGTAEPSVFQMRMLRTTAYSLKDIVCFITTVRNARVSLEF